MKKLVVIFAVMALFAFPTHSQSACPDLNDVITGLRIVSDISVSSTPTIIPDIYTDGKFGLPEIIYMLQIIAGIRGCYDYAVVDTGQSECYDTSAKMTCLASGDFYGQDANYSGKQPSYKNNGDGTITDLNTGLMWVEARGSKVTWDAAVSGASASRVGGYSDWRMPTIKELYSLINFTGKSGITDAQCTPYIDKNFEIIYGDVTGGRVIDGQDWSATEYVSTTMNGDATVFGVNFIDGRIKGYPKYQPGSGGTVGNTLYVRYVRGNTSYGKNNFVNNNNGTITDTATGLMWSQTDSGSGMIWQDALSHVQTKNSQNYLGHNDWRLPNAKELQSIVDYTRSPDAAKSAAIDPIFNCTQIINEAGKADYPFYWTGTTHLENMGAVYLAFGRAIGYMNGSWLDVHGAGAQRSDPKNGDPADYPTGFGPQGDAIRIYNYVRLVRGG